MALTFSAATPGSEPEIWQFIAGVFGMAQVPPAFTPAAMAWKYFDPHPLWPGSRSYLLRAPEGVAAHGCVAPLIFAGKDGPVPGMQVIDWAAGTLARGSGLLMFRRCLEAGGGTLLTVGGSEDTLKILPLLKWFTRIDDVHRYARPLRPWRHFAHSPKGPRDFARLLRNISWSLPRLPSPATWHCRGFKPGDDVFAPSGDYMPILRTRAWFEYLLRCPAIGTELVILEESGVPRGHAFLANTLGSVRIADFALGGETSQEQKTQAFSALLRYISAQSGAAEIVAVTSLRELRGAFEACGMHSRGVAPVYLSDPHKLIPADAQLEINMLVGDAFYLFDPAHPFAC